MMKQCGKASVLCTYEVHCVWYILLLHDSSVITIRFLFIRLKIAFVIISPSAQRAKVVHRDVLEG